MAVEAASLRMVIDSMRLMSRLYTASRVDSNPSTMKRGWLGSLTASSRWPMTDDFPRMLMSGRVLGSDPARSLVRTLKAGSSAASDVIGFCTPIMRSSSPENVDADPVKDVLSLVTIPVTTTSLRVLASSSSVMMRGLPGSALISLGFLPM